MDGKDSQEQSNSFFKRFWWVLILIVVLILLAVLAIQKVSRNNPATQNQTTNLTQKALKKDGPPLLIKNLPVNLAPYDSATGMAGDFKFTKQKLQFDILYSDFGFYIPASPDQPSKNNPQPTFIVPLGTKVHSLVDGYVVAIGKVWSGDYSIGVAENAQSQYIYETEHVINPVVKVGDKVKAGDVIAEVSDFDTGNPSGFGTVEMGILKGGNPPRHLCPFLYLDPSVKDKILSDIETLHNDWNTYMGKTIYNASDYKAPGCLMVDEIDG